jgi:ketosteroid isomerase-like protein
VVSENNVELLRRAVDAVNRRDLGSFLALMDEKVECVSRLVAIEGGMYGHEGARRWWESWFGAFPDYKIELGEVEETGDVVLVALRAAGHAARSALPFEDTAWHASEWSQGKCVWWRVLGTHVEALEAARERAPGSER